MKPILSAVLYILLFIGAVGAVSFPIITIDRNNTINDCRQLSLDTGIPTKFTEPHWYGDFWCDIYGNDNQWHRLYI